MWKSNFGRPRHRRNMSQDNRTDWLISTGGGAAADAVVRGRPRLDVGRHGAVGDASEPPAAPTPCCSGRPSSYFSSNHRAGRDAHPLSISHPNLISTAD